MAVFSTNQNRQFYVVENLINPTSKDPVAKLGDTSCHKTSDGKQIFFKHFGQGGVTRTDIIDVNSICYAKLTSAEELQRKLKKATISLDPKVNGGVPIAGQDYIVRIVIHDYLIPGDTKTTVKHGAVHAYAGLGAEEFYEKLAKSLEMNFSREAVPLLTFKSSATGVEVTEVEQPWNLGLMPQEAVNFEIIPATVRWDGSDVLWATRDDKDRIPIEDSDTVVGNGKKIADLEYFCMGERADQYRDSVSKRLSVPTKLMVDPSQEYQVLDIHYFFSDTGVNSQKSEKEITFVSSDGDLIVLGRFLHGLGVHVVGVSESTSD